MKYAAILVELSYNTIYSPGAVAHFAKDNELLPGIGQDSTKAEVTLAMTRIRVSMARFGRNHEFPRTGDAFFTFPGLRPVPGWFGWRWKAAIGTPIKPKARTK